MTEINTIEPEALPEGTAVAPVDDRIAQARARLHELALELGAVEAELDGLLGERVRHDLLERVCSTLEELDEACGADLFWDGLAAGGERAAHIGRARGRGAQVRARLDEVEGRRDGVLTQISAQNEELLLLEDEAFEHQEELERQRNEWIVERELEAGRARPHLMQWMRGEEDRRSRRSLAIALFLWVVAAVVLPFVAIPERLAPQPEQLPERVVTVIPEQKKLEKAPPPPPELTRPEKRVDPRPTPTRTAKADPQPTPTAQPTAKPQGILAFKDALTMDDLPAVANLGKAAKVSSDTGETRPERAMLSSNASGSSGGINLAAQSRGFGGGGSGERGAIKGTALTQASSGINALAAADSAAGGSSKRGGRSDEEIQVVFDRHKSALYRLYQRELRNDASLQGKVVLRLTIEPDGSVSMVQVRSSELTAASLVSDIVARVKGFNFGAKDVPAVTIVYPMNFLPAG